MSVEVLANQKTQLHIGKNATFIKTIYEVAKFVLGETNGEMDKKQVRKGNKTVILADETGITQKMCRKNAEKQLY